MSDDHRLTPQRPLLSPARWVLLAVAGGAGIYLATWIGPLSFYFSFQKKVLADGARDVNRPVVWHIPREVAYRETRGWSYARAEDGSGFPLPPSGQGDAAPRLESDGGLHLVHLEEATLRCQRFPRGFLVYLFLKELEHLGGRDDRRLSDSLILHELLGEVPGRYEFTWSARDRSTYAARILSKMLLFESRPATRLEASTRLDPLRTAVLVEFDTGDVKILRVDEEGVLVILLPADAPWEWKESPGDWLGGPRCGSVGDGAPESAAGDGGGERADGADGRR